MTTTAPANPHIEAEVAIRRQAIADARRRAEADKIEAACRGTRTHSEVEVWQSPHTGVWIAVASGGGYTTEALYGASRGYVVESALDALDMALGRGRPAKTYPTTTA